MLCGEHHILLPRCTYCIKIINSNPNSFLSYNMEVTKARYHLSYHQIKNNQEITECFLNWPYGFLNSV